MYVRVHILNFDFVKLRIFTSYTATPSIMDDTTNPSKQQTYKHCTHTAYMSHLESITCAYRTAHHSSTTINDIAGRTCHILPVIADKVTQLLLYCV